MKQLKIKKYISPDLIKKYLYNDYPECVDIEDPTNAPAIIQLKINPQAADPAHDYEEEPQQQRMILTANDKCVLYTYSDGETLLRASPKVLQELSKKIQ